MSPRPLPNPRRPAVAFVLELRANLGWRVGPGLAELLALIFPKLFNKKFNKMCSPDVTQPASDQAFDNNLTSDGRPAESGRH